MLHHSDFLIIGGGVIGLTLALELKHALPDSSITLIEKEEACGEHASGRNSGVLHAGFYYTANSLKARFSKEGNAALKAYCLEKNIPVNTCGKLVVAKNAQEVAGLEELLRRGKANRVELHMIDAQEAAKIEPRAQTHEKALFSPTTASVNPQRVIASLQEDAKQLSIRLLTGTRYLKRTPQGIMTTKGPLSTGFVINAAGLYADRIAMDFGFSQNYRILPFKGLYLYAREPAGSLRTHIYPVPDLNYPFLGVHFTLTDTGRIKIGPTAIPAFWREQYKGLTRFDMTEFRDILLRQTRLLWGSKLDYKKLALTEMQKYFGRKLVALARELVPDIRRADYVQWGKPGIRAQLLDIQKGRLESDFVIEGDENSLHILNAVSPAFTSAFPFARHIVATILESTIVKKNDTETKGNSCYATV